MEEENMQMNSPEVNETQPEETQDGINMTNDELAAAMGFMTTLGDQNMMAQQAVEGENEAEMAQGEEKMMEEPQQPEIDPEALKEEIKGELLGDVKKELKKIIKSELEGLMEDEQTEEETK